MQRDLRGNRYEMNYDLGGGPVPILLITEYLMAGKGRLSEC